MTAQDISKAIEPLKEENYKGNQAAKAGVEILAKATCECEEMYYLAATFAGKDNPAEVNCFAAIVAGIQIGLNLKKGFQ